MANRILAVTGPHEGVGKTTLAVNVAARLSQARGQPFVLLDADPLGRNELAVAAGALPGSTIPAVLDQLASHQITLAGLKNKIPLSRFGLGVLPMPAQSDTNGSLKPEQWTFFTRSCAQVYDVLIDIELFSPLKLAAFESADVIIWVLTPTVSSIRATLAQMETLQAKKFPIGKFVFVANQVTRGTPADLQALQTGLARYGKTLTALLPYEAEIPHLLNHGRPTVIDAQRNPYLHALTPLIERLLQARPGANTAVAVGTGSGAPDATVVDSMMADKRKRWNSLKQKVHRDLIEELNLRRIDLNTKGDPVLERQLRVHVESTVNALIGKLSDLNLAGDEHDRLVKELVDETLGLGPLEELLADPTITEIMVNRFDQVFVEKRGKIALSGARFIDNSHVIQVIRRIISPLGRRIDESVPMVDARLKDGSRVNAIIPPLAVSGPTLTIRRFPEKAFTSNDLIQISALTQPMVDFLRMCVMLKKNIIISGGTGTGKTTILNLLSSFIDGNERIVTVEDTAELRMQQEHVVRLEARPANIEGQGQIAIRDLVKNCLRMRPDRIVVGECRGGEALDMLQAMNTGHDGSLTTVHANSPRDAFTRLETLCLMAGMDLPVWALREQIRSAVQILVQLTRMQDGTRKVTCITEVTGRDEETILTHDLFRYVQDSVDDKGHVMGHHESTGEKPLFLGDAKSKGLLVDASMFDKGISHVRSAA